MAWQPPRIPSGAIISYELTVFSSSGVLFFSVIGSNLMFTITELSPFTNHTFEVAAINAFGRGEVARLRVRTAESGMSSFRIVNSKTRYVT